LPRKQRRRRVEFAMIAPVMIILYFGVVEIADGYDASTKASAVASTRPT
jgi:Flp pilus assembly protein TadG